jgi:hypothetical protein
MTSYRQIDSTDSRVKSWDAGNRLISRPWMHSASTSPERRPPSTLFKLPPVNGCTVRVSKTFIYLWNAGIFTTPVMNSPLPAWPVHMISSETT